MTIKLSELKSLTWVHDEKHADRHEILINHKTCHDYRLDCMSVNEKDNIFKGLKHIYWMQYGVNLPIYSVTMDIS